MGQASRGGCACRTWRMMHGSAAAAPAAAAGTQRPARTHSPASARPPAQHPVGRQQACPCQRAGRGCSQQPRALLAAVNMARAPEAGVPVCGGSAHLQRIGEVDEHERSGIRLVPTHQVDACCRHLSPRTSSTASVTELRNRSLGLEDTQLCSAVGHQFCSSYA